jgi:hypothetical protein
MGGNYPGTAVENTLFKNPVSQSTVSILQSQRTLASKTGKWKGNHALRAAEMVNRPADIAEVDNIIKGPIGRV